MQVPYRKCPILPTISANASRKSSIISPAKAAPNHPSTTPTGTTRSPASTWMWSPESPFSRRTPSSTAVLAGPVSSNRSNPMRSWRSKTTATACDGSRFDQEPAIPTSGTFSPTDRNRPVFVIASIRQPFVSFPNRRSNRIPDSRPSIVAKAGIPDLRRPSGTGVGLVVDLLHPLDRDVCIDLGRLDVTMPK